MFAHVTRRSFVAMIGLAALPQEAISVPAKRPTTVVELLQCPIAGLAYYDYARVVGAVAAGTPLALRREPANPHDRRAIEVFTEQGVKLGYVPRVDNAALASLMDAGYELRAAIVSSRAKRWERLWMAVRLVERNGLGDQIACANCNRRLR